MTTILYGLLLAHFVAYKDYYAKIGVTFAITYLIKRLVKSAGDKDNADLVGLGGYTLTIGEFIKLLNSIKKNSFTGSSSEETNEIIGGLLGQIMDSIKDIVIK